MSENTGNTPSNDTNITMDLDRDQELAEILAIVLREDLEKSLVECEKCSGRGSCHSYEIMKRNLEWGPSYWCAKRGLRIIFVGVRL